MDKRMVPPMSAEERMQHFLLLVSHRVAGTVKDTWPFSVVYDKLSVVQQHEFIDRLACDIAYEIAQLEKEVKGDKGDDHD